MAVATQRRTGPGTHRAAPWKEYVEQTTIVASKSQRKRAECVSEIERQRGRKKTASASASDSREPMSYQAPGTSHVYTGILG